MVLINHKGFIKVLVRLFLALLIFNLAGHLVYVFTPWEWLQSGVKTGASWKLQNEFMEKMKLRMDERRKLLQRKCAEIGRLQASSCCFQDSNFATTPHQHRQILIHICKATLASLGFHKDRKFVFLYFAPTQKLLCAKLIFWIELFV